MMEDRNGAEKGSGGIPRDVPENSPGSPSSPSFADPIKDALSRMQAGQGISTDEMKSRSVSLLSSRLGTNPDSVLAAFALGSAGVQADHSHYFNGFALLKPMHSGTAVAVGFSEETGVRLVVENVPEVTQFELDTPGDDIEDLNVRTVRELLMTLPNRPGRGLDIAIVSMVPSRLESAYLSSLSVSLIRAVEVRLGIRREENERIQAINESIERVLSYPFSVAYVIAAKSETADSFVLVDTETLEHLVVGSSGTTEPGWALVDTRADQQTSDRKARSEWAQEILTRLQQKQFSDLTSLRDLEHRDLEAATYLLPRRMRPGLKYLVTENRRVQRLVAAIRNEDWQLMGALMFMSHASRRDDWAITSPIQNFVVNEAERFSIEGVYGATQIGEGSFVLIAGQPFRLPAFLDHLRSSWPPNASGGPETFIL
ncbi:MAG: hypothetical protein BMS9Abin05_1107 [Rhodothermia bacterium]|nr:MAG: hypothetical protein BMS9Abin05_1107 [Rhodothermia bacterium]